jgi:hypothetical protein
MGGRAGGLQRERAAEGLVRRSTSPPCYPMVPSLIAMIVALDPGCPEDSSGSSVAGLGGALVRDDDDTGDRVKGTAVGYGSMSVTITTGPTPTSPSLAPAYRVRSAVSLSPLRWDCRHRVAMSPCASLRHVSRSKLQAAG